MQRFTKGVYILYYCSMEKNLNSSPSLLEELEQYNLKGIAPLHMPGHKRNAGMLTGAFPWELDITEIEPFDNLHNAKGMLAQCMERTAALFGSRRAFYLVNGSSCGILASICALPKGEHILVARNCHQSVFHAIELSGHMPVIIEPEFYPETAMYGAVSAAAVLEAAECYPNAAGVVLTSPTYEGLVSSISKIMEVLKPFEIPLIVDEAHGAHLGFNGYFPAGAVGQGADIVVQSLHKTLPALTQCALLHLNSDYISAQEISRQLRIFETSSPSYVLMASMDYCTQMLHQKGDVWFEDFAKRLKHFYFYTAALKKIKILENDDPSKIVIDAQALGLSGYELAERLMLHSIQVEMSADRYCVLMTSICDKDESLERLVEALFNIDKEAGVEKTPEPCGRPPKAEQILSLRAAMEGAGQSTGLDLCEDKICAEYIWTYPPGVPLVIPGQRLNRQIIEWLQTMQNVRSTYGGLPLSIRTLLT